MPSHLHLVFRSISGNPSGLLRDFKGYTSRKLIKAIHENPKESRKKWMFTLFRKAANIRSNVLYYQFWQHHNKPIELWSTKVIKQKIDYIHKNPVVAGFVTTEVEWKYSSARFYAGEQTVLEINDIGFLID
jgi:REP element-mobilizing transposase RayT